MPAAYEPAVAEKIAADAQAGDPDWTYIVKHDPKGVGFSLVAVYDEDGEFVAYLNI